MRHELTIEIGKPPKDVFPYLYDPARLVAWMDNVDTCSPRKEGAPAAGHEFDLTLRDADGNSVPALMRLTELDRNERLGFVIESDGPPAEGHFILDASPAGTTLILTRDTVERSFGERWRARRASKGTEAALRADLERLKNLVEAG